MSRNRGLIQLDKYFTQVGQLGRRARSNYGDTTLTSIITIACVLYTEQQAEVTGVPAVGMSLMHFACLPTSAAPREGDVLSSVVDQFGTSIFSSGRIVGIQDFNDPFHGSRFVQVRLDLNLA